MTSVHVKGRVREPPSGGEDMGHFILLWGDDMPFCRDKRLSPLPASSLIEPARSRSAYMLTEEEAAVYFWVVVFVPTGILFSVAAIYLIAGIYTYIVHQDGVCVLCFMCRVTGIAVAYAAPRRHPLLKVVENSCCASKRGKAFSLSHTHAHTHTDTLVLV